METKQAGGDLAAGFDLRDGASLTAERSGPATRRKSASNTRARARSNQAAALTRAQFPTPACSNSQLNYTDIGRSLLRTVRLGSAPRLNKTAALLANVLYRDTDAYAATV